MRMFVSLPLPAALHRHLGVVVKTLAAAREPELKDVRWVRPENLHVTLKFLGEVSDADVSSVAVALRKVSAAGPLMVRSNRLAFQPKRGPVHLIAAEIDGDIEGIRSLHASMEASLEGIGVARERRDLWVHVTLGRSRGGIDIHGQAGTRDEVDYLSGTRWPGPVGEVNSFELLSSTLRPEGPLFVPVATFPFAGSE